MQNKLKKIFCLSVALFMTLVTAVSCGENPSNDTSVTTEVKSIEVSAEKTTLEVDEEIQLAVNVQPASATRPTLTYEASNDVVSVSSSGVVKALKIGESIVTVKTENNLSDTIRFEVVAKDPNTYLSVEEYGELMASTPFTISDTFVKGEVGLSKQSEVGVKENSIVELYPTIDDSMLESSAIISISDIDLTDVNKYFGEVTTLDNYYVIQTAINMAKELSSQDKTVKIKFPGGKLDVDASLSSSRFAFTLDGLKNVYFDGNDTELSLGINGLNYKGYFQVNNCENVHFNNLHLSKKIHSALTGEIVKMDLENRIVTIDVDNEFIPLIKQLQKDHKPIRSYLEFSQNTRAPLLGANARVDDFSDYVIKGNDSDGYQIDITFKSPFNRSRNGTLVSLQFSQYDVQGVTIGSSNNIYVDNLEMNASYGMAFTANDVTNLFINRFNLKVKEGSQSLMTATADAFHLVYMHGDVKITNSLIEYSHDDALNIKHGYWYQLSYAEGGSAKVMELTRITASVKMPKSGDRIAVYDKDTFEGHNPKQGYYTINTIEDDGTKYRLTVNERMSNVAEWGQCRVTILSDLPDFEFSNNIVRNKRNRGILVQVPNSVVENNAFMNVGHGSIQAASSMDIYNEATIPQAITVKNNKFVNNCYLKPEPLYGDISVFAISNNASVAPSKTIVDATIENNFIGKNSNASISLRGVGDSLIKDNLFYECSQTQPSGDLMNCLIQLYNAEDITIDGNYNHYTLDQGIVGVDTQGKTLPDKIYLNENNHNILFRENEDAGPIVNVEKLTTSITIDGSIDDWTASNATDIAIDGVSDAEGSPHTAQSLEDHFKINMLKMTYDDKGIYIGFDVFDNEINVKTTNDFWLGDCVELFVSNITNLPNADMQVYKEEGGVLQAAFAPGWEAQGNKAIAAVRTNSTYVAKQNLIQAKVVLTATGYVGEILIPFEMAPELKATIDSGMPIDMAIVVADAERTSMNLKRIQAGNVPHFVENYKTKTARMPQYIFQK